MGIEVAAEYERQSLSQLLHSPNRRFEADVRAQSFPRCCSMAADKRDRRLGSEPPVIVSQLRCLELGAFFNPRRALVVLRRGDPSVDDEEASYRDVLDRRSDASRINGSAIQRRARLPGDHPSR